MVRAVFSKLMWVGKATVFVVGLAVLLAVVFGVASKATAHSGSKGLFHLGHSNKARALSTLVGTLSSSVLKVDNNGTGPALDLETQSGSPPMSISSSAKVDNLNADQLEGMDSTDFLPNSTYNKSETTFGTDLGGGNRLHEVFCNGGDTLLSGGFHGVDSTGTTVTASLPEDFHQGWYMEWTNTDGTADQITVYVLCADL